MTESRSDRELLREYLRDGSEGAFRELVSRHGPMVSSVAHRVTAGRLLAAEEITQNVFISLAKKAPWLMGRATLAGWLHRAAVLEARLWLRGDDRRLRREHEAYEKLVDSMNTKNPLPPEVTDALDEALLDLDEADRQIVVLRHCEGHTFPEIARLIGQGEDTARKRCDRAMERILQFFRRRRVAGISSAIITSALDSVPAGITANLASSITKTALTSAPLVSLGLFPILVGKFLGLSKVQAVALVAAAAILPVAANQSRLRTAEHDYASATARLEDADADYLRAARDLKRSQSRLAVTRSRLENPSLPPGETIGFLNATTWVDGSPYARIPKSIIGQFKPLGLTRSWGTPPQLRQLLGLTEKENSEINNALVDFTHEIRRQNETHSRRVSTNPAIDGATEETIMFVIAERQDEAKATARKLESSITGLLGPERGPIALKHFDLPLLPEGTTDYETHPDYDRQISSHTAPSQGLEWHITFHRAVDDQASSRPYVEISFKSGQATMQTRDPDFNHQSIPQALRNLWQSWKQGVPLKDL